MMAKLTESDYLAGIKVGTISIAKFSKWDIHLAIRFYAGIAIVPNMFTALVLTRGDWSPLRSECEVGHSE